MTKTLRDIVPLQELSKKTLGSYINAASKDRDKLVSRRAELEKKIQAAHDAEDWETHGHEGSDQLQQIRFKLRKTRDKVDHKRERRRLGIRRALKRLTKEDIDYLHTLSESDFINEWAQLDEISRKTLLNYISKSKNNLGMNMYQAGSLDNSPSKRKVADKLAKKAGNRERGIDRALSRLKESKEEQLDEISKKTLGSYIKKASKNIEGITRSKTEQEMSAIRSNRDLSLKVLKRKLKNRHKGIDRAASRLTKEDIDYLYTLLNKESLDEGCQEDNFDRYLASATKVAQEISALLKSYSSHVKSNSTYYPVYTVKEYARNLEDIYDRLTEAVEYAEQDAKRRKQYSDTQAGTQPY